MNTREMWKSHDDFYGLPSIDLILVKRINSPKSKNSLVIMLFQNILDFSVEHNGEIFTFNGTFKIQKNAKAS